MSATSVFTPRAARYLDDIDARLRQQAPRDIADRIESLVKSQDAWRAQYCLNMNPAESLMSRRCRDLLASDMATRLTEGQPGDKLYPHGPQNERIDEIEAVIIALVRRMFGARFVEWRPVSVCMANAAVFFALLSAGDTILVQSEDGGGNYSYHRRGPAGLVRANIVSIPPRGPAFEIDLEAIARQAREHRPKLIVIGGSNVLFPYPVRELRSIADDIGALLLYDAAHLGLLIAGGEFQSPLREGAHLVTISSAKSMGGPLGGLVLTNDPQIAARVTGITFPGFVQMRDENKYSGQALALAEMLEFAPVLARRTVANAQALARSLTAEGFDVIGTERGYTQTHQIFLNLGDRAQTFETRCHAANILLSDCALVGDISRGRRTGARLATHELTRVGMEDADMCAVARFIGRAFRGDDPVAIAAEVAHLIARHPGVKYSFDGIGR